MRRKRSILFALFIVVCLLGGVSLLLRADPVPASADPVRVNTDYQWGDKLGRGILNMVGSPVELARTIHIQSRVKGPGYGWTMGAVEGLGRAVVRLGAGAIETVTCPFDFPKEDKSPLLEPEYPWQKWDDEYL